MPIQCVQKSDNNICTNPWCEETPLVGSVYKTTNGDMLLLSRCPYCNQIYANAYQLRKYPNEFVVINHPVSEKKIERKKPQPSPKEDCDNLSRFSAYIYENSDDIPVQCLNPKCDNGKLIRRKVFVKNKEKKVVPIGLLRCEQCRTFICPDSVYLRNRETIKGTYLRDILNIKAHEQETAQKKVTLVQVEKKLIDPAKTKRSKAKVSKKVQLQLSQIRHSRDLSDEDKKKKNEQYLAAKEAFFRRQKERELEEAAKKEADELREKQINEEKHLQKMKKQRDENIRRITSEANSIRKKHIDGKITFRDFIIRRSVFRCMHEEHSLKNIGAIVTLIDNEGDYIERLVSAGYCEHCNIYYMLDSTYTSLKKEGCFCCRVYSERHLLGSGNSNNSGLSNLSETSVLMDYGYSVSAQKKIPTLQRQAILAMLIDNGLITKIGVLSYLDFFINHLGHNPRLRDAVPKWKADWNFVAYYQPGSYKKVYVGSIRR